MFGVLRHQSLGFILITVFLTFMGFSIIIPVIPFLMQKYVGSNSGMVGLHVGLLMSVFAFCQFLAAPGLGALSDKYGRRPILLISLLGSVIGYLLIGIGGALWIIYLGRIIDGLTGGNISTAYAYIADIAEPKERGKYYGLLGAAGGFGFMIGPAIGGLTAGISLSFPFYLAAGVTVVNMIWGYCVLPESLPKQHILPEVNFRHLNPFAHFQNILSVGVLRQIFAVGFITFFAVMALQSNLSVFVKDVFHWNPSEVGILLFIVGVIDILAQGVIVRKLLPLIGPIRVASIGIICNAIGFGVIALSAWLVSPVVLYLAVVVYDIGDGLFEPSFGAVLSNMVGPHMQGRIQGANQSMQSLARVVGPLYAAMLYEYGKNLPYLVNIPLCALALVVLLLSYKKITTTKVT